MTSWDHAAAGKAALGAGASQSGFMLRPGWGHRVTRSQGHQGHRVHRRHLHSVAEKHLELICHCICQWTSGGPGSGGAGGRGHRTNECRRRPCVSSIRHTTLAPLAPAASDECVCSSPAASSEGRFCQTKGEGGTVSRNHVKVTFLQHNYCCISWE